jgi:hypothetical protein
LEYWLKASARMTPIPVKGYPFERTYASFEEAIAGAKAHPLQPKSQLDAERLKGTCLVDGYWTLSHFVLRFSNEMWLHVFVDSGLARWTLAEKPPLLNEAEVERVGVPPIVLAWGGEIGDKPMDRSALLAKRRGADFTRLWVNECGFFVYTRKQLILIFHALYRTDTGEDVLYVTEDD